MILELVQWTIKPDQEGVFEEAFTKAQSILASAKGYISHQFQRCIENPRNYILLVEWETLEDHTVGFRGSDSYQEYKAHLKPHYEPGASMSHYLKVHGNAQ